jgi:hypothetical protein
MLSRTRACEVTIRDDLILEKSDERVLHRTPAEPTVYLEDARVLIHVLKYSRRRGLTRVR